MARRRGLFDDVMSIGLKLPWKVALAAAVITFIATRPDKIEVTFDEALGYWEPRRRF